jgi:hypothetical protein
MIVVIDAQLAWWPPTFIPSLLAHVVGIVDRPGGKPAQARVEGFERLNRVLLALRLRNDGHDNPSRLLVAAVQIIMVGDHCKDCHGQAEYWGFC